MRGLRSGQGLITSVNPYNKPILFTPVVTWGANTISGATGAFIKESGKMLVWVSFQETAGTAAAALTITIPVATAWTAITLAGSLSAGVGFLSNNVGANTGLMTVVAGGTTQIVSGINPTGAIGTYFGQFTIPTIA